MGVSDDQLAGINALTGINNVQKEGATTPATLREAINVDLDADGKLSRRAGTTPVAAGAAVHSLWSDPHLDFGLFADGEQFKALFSDERVESLGAGLVPGLPLSYERVNDQVFWSNGAQSGMVTIELDVVPWAAPEPAGQPTVGSAIATGGLSAGDYQVAISYRDERGRESGSTLAVEVAVPEGGGIALTNIPQPVNPDGIPTIRVYATAAGGSTLNHVVDLSAGTTSYTIGTGKRGKQLDTQFMVKMPPGHIVRAWNGRLLVARGRNLLWSGALRYGLYNPARNRTGFRDRLSVVAPVGEGDEMGAGVFVAAGHRTYWLGGGAPEAFRQKIAYPYGAVPGTELKVPANVFGLESTTEVSVWLASNGLFVAGLPGGIIVPFNTDQAVTDVGEAGASLFREMGGIRQFLTSIQAPTTPGLAVRDTATVKEYRHG